MARTPSDLVGMFRSPTGVKLFRYSMASVVALATSTVLFVLFDGAIGFSAVVSATLATAIAAIPSYELNRRWAWGKSGRSHLFKEVIPFWTLAFIGWAFATFSVRLMEDYAKSHHFSHPLQTATVTLVYIGAFGVLWIGKFIIFNKFMFVHHHHHDATQELDGASGATA